MGQDKTQFLVRILCLVGVLFLFLGVTFAAFTYFQPGVEQNVMSTGTLQLSFLEPGSTIVMENAVPVQDEVGMVQVPYQFVIRNIGTTKARYRVKLVEDTVAIEEDLCIANLIPYSAIKYQLVKGDSAYVSLLSDATNLIIDSGEIAPGEEVSYALRLWLDSTAGNEVMGHHYHGKVQVDVIQAVDTNEFDQF